MNDFDLIVVGGGAQAARRPPVRISTMAPASL